MIFNWQGRDYSYDMAEGVTVKEAVVIKAHTGHGLKTWWQGIGDLEPESVASLLWLVKKRNGEACEIASLDFDIMAFVQAFTAAVEASAPKDPSPPGQASSEPASTV